MEERIDRLLNDLRLDDLMVTPEFRRARERLFYMQKKVKNGEQIGDHDREYIEYAEKHIENIDPHWDYGSVDGQLVPYRVTTKKEGADAPSPARGE